MNQDSYTKEFDGDQIDNQPGYSAVDTGYYFTDYYGCWHRIEVKEIIDTLEHSVVLHNLEVGSTIYMIGEYPQWLHPNYLNEQI